MTRQKKTRNHPTRETFVVNNRYAATTCVHLLHARTAFN